MVWGAIILMKPIGRNRRDGNMDYRYYCTVLEEDLLMKAATQKNW